MRQVHLRRESVLLVRDDKLQVPGLNQGTRIEEYLIIIVMLKKGEISSSYFVTDRDTGRQTDDVMNSY